MAPWEQPPERPTEKHRSKHNSNEREKVLIYLKRESGEEVTLLSSMR